MAEKPSPDNMRMLTEALKQARADVATQHKVLDSVGTPGLFGEGVLTRETAILQAKAIRELTAALEKSAAELADSSSASASALTFWTKVLAVTTGVLAFAALIQAVDIFLRWFQ